MSKAEYETVKASDLATRYPGLGTEGSQAGRTGGISSWQGESIRESLERRGWVQGAGPDPVDRKGDRAPTIGNRRLTVVSQLAQEKPSVWGNVKVKILSYPSDTTDEEMHKVAAAELASTKVQTRADLVRFAAIVAGPIIVRGRDVQKGVAEAMGIPLCETLKTFKDGALETVNGIRRIKPGLSLDKVFRQKDIIMEGIAAAKMLGAFNEVATLFLEPTEKRYLNADELYLANQNYEADCKAKPSIRSVRTLKELAEHYPQSSLLAQVGPIFAEGRDKRPGSKPGGKRSMNVAQKNALRGMLKSEVADRLFDAFDGLPGAADDEGMGILKALFSSFVPTETQQALIQQHKDRCDAFALANADKVKAAVAEEVPAETTA